MSSLSKLSEFILNNNTGVMYKIIAGNGTALF
jgi:hypothetical protein